MVQSCTAQVRGCSRRALHVHCASAPRAASGHIGTPSDCAVTATASAWYSISGARGVGCHARSYCRMSLTCVRLATSGALLVLCPGANDGERRLDFRGPADRGALGTGAGNITIGAKTQRIRVCQNGGT